MKSLRSRAIIVMALLVFITLTMHSPSAIYAAGNNGGVKETVNDKGNVVRYHDGTSTKPSKDKSTTKKPATPKTPTNTPTPATTTQPVSKYETYTDEKYMEKMMKVYKPDTAMMSGAEWAFVIAGTLITLFSTGGFFILIFSNLIFLWKVLIYKESFKNKMYWRRSLFFTVILLLSMSGGMVMILSQFFDVIQTGGET